jgi:hypothetical protein
VHHLLKGRHETRRHGDHGHDLPVLQLALRLVFVEMHERDVARDLVDRLLHVERVIPDHDLFREAVEVDEADARLRARVAGDEPEQRRDHQRVEEENRE